MPFTASCIPSSTRAFPMSVALSALALHHDWWLAIGIHVGGPPAVFSDLSSVATHSAEDYSTYSESYGAGAMSASASFLVGALTGQGGRDYWACLFNAFPSGSDVPIAIAGPFVVSSY